MEELVGEETTTICHYICAGCSIFLMPRCNGCSADDDHEDFGHFIFKAHFEHFLEFLDSRTQGVN